MAHKFKPCVNRIFCTNGGERCRACGRSHEEIEAVRSMTNKVTEFIQQMNYENSDDFLEYLGKKVRKNLKKSKTK